METRLSNLKSVMAVQTTSYNTKKMNKFLIDYMSGMPGVKVYKNKGNIYATKGKSDAYPCVVAHTDTVHDIENEFHVQRHKDVLYAINEKYERVGIGGDDKVGIFVALQALEKTDNIKVAFFRDEEVGCVGSGVADMSFFSDVGFVLQCDRRGYADFVSSIYSTKLYSDEFSQAVAPYLAQYDRVEADGGLTDVYQLTKNGLEVSVANMSCGYYDPHTENEYIVISEVFRTADFVQDVIDNLGGTKFTIKTADREVLSKWVKSRYYSYGDSWSYNDRYSDYIDADVYDSKSDTDDLVCTCCGTYGELEYDESVQMHWCHTCQDYIDDDDIEDWTKDSYEGFYEDEILEDTDGNKDLPF